MKEQLEKLLTILKMIGINDNIDFYKKSKKNHDYYYLKIKTVRKQSNNEAMLIFEEEIATLSLNIRINSNTLFEAYKLLNEEEKIPKYLNIINPCFEDNYMNSFVETCYFEIIINLKDFNGISDNYASIATILGKSRGTPTAKKYCL